MSMFQVNRQNHSGKTLSTANVLVIAVLLGVITVLWWSLSDAPKPDHSAATDRMASADRNERTAVPREIVETMNGASEEDFPSPDRGLQTHDRSLNDLEREFLDATDKQAQLDAATEIAGYNDEAAVQSLARLFRRAQHPDVKEALLAALADIAPDTAPTARITLLQGALFGQPRNVRLIALDALAQVDDPRAVAALQRAAREDPDKLIREAAAAFASAVENEQP